MSLLAIEDIGTGFYHSMKKTYQNTLRRRNGKEKIEKVMTFNRKAWCLKQLFPSPRVVREAYGTGYALFS